LTSESVTPEHLLGEIEDIKKKLAKIEQLLMVLIEDEMISEEELKEIRKVDEIISKEEYNKLIRVA
jgi:hypothetical protein